MNISCIFQFNMYMYFKLHLTRIPKKINTHLYFRNLFFQYRSEEHMCHYPQQLELYHSNYQVIILSYNENFLTETELINKPIKNYITALEVACNYVNLQVRLWYFRALKQLLILNAKYTAIVRLIRGKLITFVLKFLALWI